MSSAFMSESSIASAVNVVSHINLGGKHHMVDISTVKWYGSGYNPDNDAFTIVGICACRSCLPLTVDLFGDDVECLREIDTTKVAREEMREELIKMSKKKTQLENLMNGVGFVSYTVFDEYKFPTGRSRAVLDFYWARSLKQMEEMRKNERKC